MSSNNTKDTLHVMLISALIVLAGVVTLITHWRFTFCVVTVMIVVHYVRKWRRLDRERRRKTYVMPELL